MKGQRAPVSPVSEVRAPIPYDDIVGWDHGTWGHLLRIWSGPIEESTPQKFLELGANAGGLSLWAALFGHDVTCSDYQGVGQAAKTLHQRHGVTPKYAAVDAANILDRGFNMIAAKSVLVSVSRDGGLGRIKQAARSIHDALEPGGRFLFAENMRGTVIHKAARNRLTTWASELTYPTDSQWDDILSPFSHVQRERFGVLSPFGFGRDLKRLLGRCDVSMARIFPNDWKVVTIGVAQKQ